MFRAIGALLILSSMLVAADRPVAVPSLSLEAGEGGALSLRPDAPSQLRGGVKAVFQGVRLFSDSLVFTRSPCAGSSDPVLSDGDIGSGPLGPVGEHGPVVELDTREAVHPNIGFRGLLTPGQVHVSRLPAADPRRPTRVSYLVSLIPLGHFAGNLRQGGVWRPYRGWADRAEATVVAEVGPHGLENPRFAAIHLFGRPVREDRPRERAWLVGPRPTQVVPGSSAGLDSGPVVLTRAEAMDFILRFDDQGSFKDLVPGGDFRLVDVPAPAASASVSSTATGAPPAAP